MAKKSEAPEGVVEAAEFFPAYESAAEESAPPAETRAPDGWRDEIYPMSATGRPHADGWKHSAAEALHQWRKHAHHANAPMLLTRADYEAACAAVCNADARGEYAPHPAALSPHAGSN